MEPLPRIVETGIRRRAFWAVVAAVFVADLASKWLAFALCGDPPQAVWVWEGYFSISPSYNRGAAFSILHDMDSGRMVLIAINAALLGMLVQMARQPSFAPAWFGIACIIGGASANLHDRVLLGHVRDFLRMGWWPTFNVADVALCVGVGLLLVHLARPVPQVSHSNRES